MIYRCEGLWWLNQKKKKRVSTSSLKSLDESNRTQWGSLRPVLSVTCLHWVLFALWYHWVGVYFTLQLILPRAWWTCVVERCGGVWVLMISLKARIQGDVEWQRQGNWSLWDQFESQLFPDQSLEPISWAPVCLKSSSSVTLDAVQWGKHSDSPGFQCTTQPGILAMSLHLEGWCQVHYVGVSHISPVEFHMSHPGYLSLTNQTHMVITEYGFVWCL